MTTREDALDAFQTAAGWAAADRSLLAGDASFRTYYRLVMPDQTAVLMDAPPPHEDVRPFLKIARHLVDIGLSAPHILAEDVPDGFLLLEDLGDDTYTRLLERGGNERALYALAVDALAVLHRHAPPTDAVPYDTARLLDEVSVFPDWFLPSVGAKADAAALTAWDTAWRQTLPTADGAPKVLVLRDYHVDNLLLLPDRPGPAACGLLDFQDAKLGPAPYDLMSLLEDARRDIAPALVRDMTDRYLAEVPVADRDAFAASWAVLAAQRHTRVIGVFARLNRRDGKPGYLRHMPRLWRLLEQALEHPACAPLRKWFNTHVPAEVRRRTPA